MAVAPVLPWRKASTELLRDRLFWPAWCGAGALVIAVAARRRRTSRPLLAFVLGGFAAGAALRQLRAGHAPSGLARPGRTGQRRHGRAPRRDHHRGRAGRVEQLHHGRRVQPATTASRSRYDGHTFELVRRCSSSPRPLDGHQGARSASTVARRTRRRSPSSPTSAPTIPTPSVRNGPFNDIYLTLRQCALRSRHRGARQDLHQAADRVAVDRRDADGGRHRAGRLPWSPPTSFRPTRCPLRSISSPPVSEPSVTESNVGGRGRRRLAPFVSLAVAALLVALFVVLASGKSAKPDVTSSFLLGKPAPAMRQHHARRQAVRPHPPQGQLGGAQLLPVDVACRARPSIPNWLSSLPNKPASPMAPSCTRC